MENKYVVIAMWDSCDPSVYGLFKSYKKANKFRKKWEWDERDENMYLQIEKLQGTKQ